MSGLIESFEAQFAAMPATTRDALGLGEARGAALSALRAAGIPGPRSEAWRYTPLRALARQAYAGAEAVAADAGTTAALAAIPAPRLVFVNGHYEAGLSDLAGLPGGVDLQPLSQALRGDDPRAVNVLARRFNEDHALFARANAALAVDGALLRVAAGVTVQPVVQLVFVGQPGAVATATHLRCLLELREQSALRVVEHWVGGAPSRDLATSVMHVHLKPGARLQQVRVQRGRSGQALFAQTEAVLASDARYRRLDIELGTGLSRHVLNVSLQGTGAAVQADGVLLGDARAHVDTRLGIDHAAPATTSTMTWRGLGRGQARVAFHGGILIRAGADGSDAMLSNKNLLLSGQAEIDTQPVLEIHADEVKAAHGATVGQLDPAALFYLRSRGLPLAAAQALLTSAFCHALLDGLALDAAEADLAGWLDAALQVGGAP